MKRKYLFGLVIAVVVLATGIWIGSATKLGVPSSGVGSGKSMRATGSTGPGASAPAASHEKKNIPTSRETAKKTMPTDAEVMEFDTAIIRRDRPLPDSRDLQTYLDRFDNDALLNHADIYQDLPIYLCLTEEENFKWLIAHGANFKARDSNGSTILSGILRDCVYGRSGVDAAFVEYLLKAGTDPNIRDKYGMTALGYARKLNNGGIVDLLTKAGAN
jgi:hypothetical protein